MVGTRPDLKTAVILALIATAIIPVNFWVWTQSELQGWFATLAMCQLVAGLLSAFFAGRAFFNRDRSRGQAWDSAMVGLGGLFVGFLGLVGYVLGEALQHASWGGAWGRPLRLRGRILHPRLRAGSDWTRGARPKIDDLDAPTCAALEALWLHDAQKEHASVPAFARISWVLVAIGAPAELVEGAHRAALEEIDHARRCFALAAGYGERSHAVEPMPDLLVGGLDVKGDPLEWLATESLTDGCLLEDFNADVAAACEAACREPAARDVLGRIAREERSHADFSWALLTWLLARREPHVNRAVAEAATVLARVRRPTLASAANAGLVARADPDAVLRHGRVPDEVWARLWQERLIETSVRVNALLIEYGAALNHSSNGHGSSMSGTTADATNCP